MGHQLDVNQLVDFRYDNALSNDNLWSSNNIMLVNKTSLRSNLSCDYQRCLNAKGLRISRTKDMWTVTLVKLRVEMRETRDYLGTFLETVFKISFLI